MKEKSKGVLVALMVVVIAAMACPVLAQDKPADNMQIVLEKIRADKRLLVADNMQLTEGEAKAFWPVYDRYQDELFLLRVRFAKLITDYAEAYKNMNDTTARKLLDEYLATEALGLKLRQAYLPRFRKVLPQVKVARYYQIENKIQAVLMYELARNIPLVEAAK
jgi:hypothetical protein